jgi:hypothetical protein
MLTLPFRDPRAGAPPPDGVRRTGARVKRPAATPSGKQLLALDLVEAAPDAVGLTDAEGIVEAVLLDPATLADLLGPPLALELLFLALELRRGEEHRRLGSSACSPHLPFFYL